jgi:tetratricopeptide (TPR) repeat protein
MKKAKPVLAMILLLSFLSLALHAYGDLDILDFLPAMVSKSKCNFAGLRQMFLNYAQQAAALVDPGDKTQVLSYVNLYPEGKDPPQVTETATGDYDVQVTCKAAAFYVIGAKAVLQGNRKVAFWCFCEAARRNPAEPIFLNNGAFVLVDFGYFADARKALECAQSLAPDFNSVYVNLGAALSGLGNFAAAAENYKKAYYNFPNNGEYLRLAAQAYKSAGMADQAYILGQMGLNSFPDLLDWNAFLTSLNYPPPEPPSCPNESACLYDPNCWNFSLSDQFLPGLIWGNAMDQYSKTVYNPADDNAWAVYGSCSDSVLQSKRACPDDCCRARMDTVSDQCFLSYRCTVYMLDLDYYAYSHAAWAADCTQVENNLNQKQGQFTSAQFAYLQCFQKNYIASQTAAMAQDEAAQLAGDLSEIENSSNNVSVDANWADMICSLSNAYRQWLLTGHATNAFEPTFCLAILCFSYDTVSNNVGVSVSFGPSLKLTYDPFTHKMGLGLGLGLKIGAGPYNLGAAIWLKLDPSKVGVEPKANFGFSKIGYFLGYEQI